MRAAISILVRRVISVSGVVLLAACATDDPTAPAPHKMVIPGVQLATAGTETNTYLVEMKAGRSVDALNQGAGSKAGMKRIYGGLDMVSLTGISDADVAALRKHADVANVIRDREIQWIPAARSLVKGRPRTLASVRPAGTDQSGAAFYADQWNIRTEKADKAWAISNGGKGRLVCVLDSGIDPNHVDLKGKIDLSKVLSVISQPVFPGDLDPLDYNFHGTFVAGVITTNGLGIASVAPDARLCSIKVLNVTGSGSFADLIYGIIIASDLDADVINLSLGAYFDVSVPGGAQLLAAVQKALDFAQRNGALVVAASGNDGVNLETDAPQFRQIPAEQGDIMSIGATAPVNQMNFDKLATYSNFGGPRGIDMVAPGGDFVSGGVVEDLILSTCSQYQLTLPFACGAGSFVFGSGTSFSTPAVSAAALVVESQFTGQKNPTEIRKCLQRTADKVGPVALFGQGRLNVEAAAKCAL